MQPALAGVLPFPRNHVLSAARWLFPSQCMHVRSNNTLFCLFHMPNDIITPFLLSAPYSYFVYRYQCGADTSSCFLSRLFFVFRFQPDAHIACHLFLPSRRLALSISLSLTLPRPLRNSCRNEPHPFPNRCRVTPPGHSKSRGQEGRH